MKGGVLEVLLVSAEGLKHGRFLGLSSQYVVIHCGSQIRMSKITTGKDRRVWWNEKFIFKLRYLEWKGLAKIKLKVMEKDKFLEDRFIGEATIHLRGILREGHRKDGIELKPAPYNVVLKDGTYEGELKVGLKFNTDVDMEPKTEGNVAEKRPQSVYRAIFDFSILQKIQWTKFFFFPKCAKLIEGKKD